MCHNAIFPTFFVHTVLQDFHSQELCRDSQLATWARSPKAPERIEVWGLGRSPGLVGRGSLENLRVTQLCHGQVQGYQVRFRVGVEARSWKTVLQASRLEKKENQHTSP